jgi:hypothetical protein
MTTNKWPLKIDADLPGVITTVTQEVDFSSLAPTQLRRVVRAVERGHTPRTGYVAGLVRATATHLGVAPPLTFSGMSVVPLPEDKWAKPFANLLKLSKVRWEIEKAATPGLAKSWYHRQEPGWTSWSSSTLQFLGWKGQEAQLKKEIEKVLRANGYYEGLQQLADFIKTAPRFEV